MHICKLFSFHAWTGNIRVSPSTIKTFLCRFSSLSSLKWQLHPLVALRDTAIANQLITTLPIFVSSLCPLTSTSTDDGSHCFPRSSGDFSPSPAMTEMHTHTHTHSTCVPLQSRGFLWVWDYMAGRRDRCTAKRNTHALLHTSVVTFPPSNH